MSKALYYRERALEDALRADIDYSFHQWGSPADYAQQHGFHGVGHAFQTVPTGWWSTPVNMHRWQAPNMENEYLSPESIEPTSILALSLLAGFFLFLR